MTRDAALAAFLADSPWAGAARLPLAGDASLRRYERLEGGPSPALLVDAPPPEDTALFVRMADWLRSQGLLAPKIHQADAEAGFLLVEDFGDGLLARLCTDRPEIEASLYNRAVAELVRLQGAPVPDFLPAYDDAFFLFEIGIFAEWAATGLPAPVREDLLQRWQGVLPAARVGRDVVVHRDFHALNLLAVGERFALIDFQGARIGPPTYDLVSLLVDARRDVAEGTVAAAAGRYLDLRPDLDAERFTAACAIMAAQRTTKILGLFRRLAVRDGKTAYQALLPRVRTQLQQALDHPALGPIRDWHTQHGFGS
ncbi:aminoglycoside phosphotransferase family protein [Geminicoccus flavidas]|uniref:aminoglycoside phosphotransferase family protein n=1 Tax=Geminicoccus flavidas TaxID=2506407 RepID=UPI00135C1B36|nr:phosphotransferase [Geminicoccus flavidas]